MMKRNVLPEHLDSLPVDDPGALANRRELRFFNWFLGTNAWFRGVLVPLLKKGDRVLEVGAGEGLLIDHLASLNRHNDELHVSWKALDNKPAFKGHSLIEFVVKDLLQLGESAHTDVIFGNMILHQFETSELEQLGKSLGAHARLLVFQEPVRSSLHHALCRIVTLPMSRVSRHDARVSIRAGFRGSELPDVLGLREADWDIRIGITLRGAYRMTARRK